MSDIEEKDTEEVCNFIYLHLYFVAGFFLVNLFPYFNCLSYTIYTQQLFDPTQKKKKKKKPKVNFEDDIEPTVQETAQEPTQQDAEPGWFDTVALFTDIK
jgi:hypothetical protein